MKLVNFLLALTIAAVCSAGLTAAPAKTGGAYEITTENLDSGGSPVGGYTGGTYSLIQAIGEPGGITGLSGGAFFIQSGYLGQDLIAPKSIILNSSLDVQNGAFNLFWSAPGDDYAAEQLQGGTKFCIATTTVLTDAQNEGYWYNKRNSNGCEIVITTGSVNSGDSSNDIILNMNEGSTYYFRIWTLDQAGNWSDISSGATTYFLWAPGAITDLKAYAGQYGRTIRLVWTAPGNNGYTGTLKEGSKFAIQRSTWTNVAFSTSSLDTIVFSTSSVDPGTLQAYTLTSLQQGVTYYVRMWTADETPSWAGVSNSSSALATWVMLSLTVPTTWFDYGTLQTGISTDTFKAAVVTNSGNVYQTYGLKGTDTQNMNLSTVPGENKFAMRAAFNASRPAALGDFDAIDNILSLTDSASSNAKFSIDGNYTGSEVDPFPIVPSDADRNLWFKLSTPLAVSSTDYQNIYITISAQEANP